MYFLSILYAHDKCTTQLINIFSMSKSAKYSMSFVLVCLKSQWFNVLRWKINWNKTWLIYKAGASVGIKQKCLDTIHKAKYEHL